MEGITTITLPNWLAYLVLGLHVVSALIGLVGVVIAGWVWGSAINEKRRRG